MKSTQKDPGTVPLGTAPEIVSDYGRYCRPEMARMLHALSLDAVYEREITSHSGRQTRFVIVGRPTRQSPWQIVSIGTGP